MERAEPFSYVRQPWGEVCNCEQNWKVNESTSEAGMTPKSVLLCIHRDPAQLRVLQENGYELLTAVNGHEGLQLFESQPVDAVVLEYNLSLLDGSVIASEIKQVQPNLPIVMLAEPTELPDGALQAVDALVPTSDPPHFVWAAVHFALSARRLENCRAKLRVAQARPAEVILKNHELGET